MKHQNEKKSVKIGSCKDHEPVKIFISFLFPELFQLVSSSFLFYIPTFLMLCSLTFLLSLANNVYSLLKMINFKFRYLKYIYILVKISDNHRKTMTTALCSQNECWTVNVVVGVWVVIITVISERNVIDNPTFISLMRLFMFIFALMSLGKTWILLFSFPLRITSMGDWFLYLWSGNQSRKRKTLNLNKLYSA